MKNILIILMLIIPGVLIAQTDSYVKDLPEYTTIANDSTHVMYIDAGGIDKHVEMPTFLQVISDSVRLVVSAMEDSIAAIRAGVAGGGAFSKVGHKVYLTDTGDSLGIGVTAPAYKVDIDGQLRTTGYAYLNRVIFGSGASGQIWSVGDDLFFHDNAAGLGVEGITLQQLRDGIYNLNGTTYYPPAVNNFNFGGVSATTNKVNVTGTLGITSHIYSAGDLFFAGSGGGYGAPNPRITKTGNTLMFGDESGTYSLSDLASVTTGDVSADTVTFTDGNVFITANTGAPNDQLIFSVDGVTSTLYNLSNKNIFTIHGINFNTESAPPHTAEGVVYYNTTTNKLHVYNGTSWDTLSTSSGTGTGVVDTTGLPVANEVTFFTAENKIGGNADFTYNPTTGQLYVGNALYIQDARSYINPAVTNNAGNIANLLGTNVAYTANAKMAQVNSLATARWYVKNDSTVTLNYTVAEDTVYLKYVPTSNSTRWVGISHAKGLYADSTAAASFMTKWEKRPSLKESIDTLDGEFIWYTYDENGIHAWRGVENIPRLGSQIQSIVAGIEYNRLELYERDQRIDKLERQVAELLARDKKMTRLDYKLKLKMLKAEQRLK